MKEVLATMNTHTSYKSAVQKHVALPVLIPSGGAFTRPEQNGAVLSVDRISSPTMSSLDIAMFTDKEHKHVLTDIRGMLKSLGLHSADFSAQYKDSSGRTLPCFNLPRREVDILITGYSVNMRAKVIDRWHELEVKAAIPVIAIDDANSLRTHFLGYANHILQLKDQVTQNAVKAEFYDDMADTGDLFNIGAVSPTFGTGRTRVLQYMRKHKILKSNGNKHNLPYQKHLDAGRFEVRWLHYRDPKTGERKLKPQPLFTGKGIIWFQKFIEKNGRDGL
jgi:anti-repressor protein